MLPASAAVPLPSRRELHPLLLEPHYWRDRLQHQRSVRHFLLRVPRPDLSSPACEVEEVRFRSHDGVRLWGLVGRCPLLHGQQPALLRTVGACERPAINPSNVQDGFTEIVLQFPAGRRLEDRVLDVLRTCDLALNLQWVDVDRVQLSTTDSRDLPDELRIAEQLRSTGLIS